jgi:pyrroline-5-carboxylate reductase
MVRPLDPGSDMTDNSTGIIGIGRLGEAVASAVLARPDHGTLHVTRRNTQRVDKLACSDSRVRPDDAEKILRACDDIVVALRPKDARALLASLEFEPRHRIVSVMAEIGLDELRDLTRGAGSTCRVLVMPSVVQGGQLLPLYPKCAAAERMFGQSNELMPVESEDELMLYWSITALLSSVMTIGDVASRWLETAGIDRSKATAYTRTLYSDVHAASAPGFAEGLDHVSTPGGLNMAMREKLLATGVEAMLSTGLDEIHRRLTIGMPNGVAHPSGDGQ